MGSKSSPDLMGWVTGGLLNEIARTAKRGFAIQFGEPFPGTNAMKTITEI
jgi:hypothetical protein